jgi:gamma-glutamylcyclotransferase (GGCT)/AIG2-like uncharacterized protein YtfP
MPIHVFVYGTLQPGERGYQLCAKQAISVDPAIARGQLYHLPLGYPALAIAGNDLVYGYRLSFADASILQLLDDYERHAPELFAQSLPGEYLDENQYTRQEIATFDFDQTTSITAWSYVMTTRQIQRLGGTLVPEGRWNSQIYRTLVSDFG